MPPAKEIYKSLRPSIVAFVSKFSPVNDESDRPPPFPFIVGTGFVVHEDGLIATNAHVARAFPKVFKPDDLPADNWPVRAVLFHVIEAGQVEVSLEIQGAVMIEGFKPGKVYYGPKEGPDLALLQVNVKGLPTLKLDTETHIEEGIDVLTAGYPMGTDAFTAPGWLHQITPTLQKGIVSAVLPYPCAAKPHAFSIDVMTQGGASGSPVVSCDTGGVIGVLYAGLNSLAPTADPKNAYRVPTSISYVVPSHYLAHAIDAVRKNPEVRPPPKCTDNVRDVGESRAA